MSMSFQDTGSYVDGGNQNREPAWDKDINWFEIPDDNEIHAYRLVAGPFYYSQHWVQTKKRDGQTGKSFPAICRNWDSETNTYAENGCELCEFLTDVNKALADVNKNTDTKKEWKELPSMVTRMSRRLTMATNLISRDLQHAGPPSNNSEGWSFIRPARFPQGLAKRIKEKGEKLNKRDGQTYPLNHSSEGQDLLISYNSEKKEPNDRYSLDLGGVTPLAEAEMAHQPFLTDFKAFIKYPKGEELVQALKRFGYYDWLNEFKGAATMVSVPRSAPAPMQPQQMPQQNMAQHSTPPQAPVQNMAPVHNYAEPVSNQPVTQVQQMPQQAQYQQPVQHQQQMPQQAQYQQPPQHQSAPVQPPVQHQAPPPQQSSPNPNAAAFATPAAPEPTYEDEPEPAASAQPAQPPVQPPQQPVAQTPPPQSGSPQGIPNRAPVQAAGVSSDVESRMVQFIQSRGLQTRVSETQYTKQMRLYVAGMTVPACWEMYNQVSRQNKEQCRACPLRLDCMMVSN